MDSEIRILDLKEKTKKAFIKRNTSKREKQCIFFKYFFLCLFFVLFIIFCIYMLVINNTINIANRKIINEILNITKIYRNEHNQILDIIKNITLYQSNERKEMLNIINNKIINKTINETINEKLKLLKLITNNNKYQYEGAEKCLLNDPDSQYCIYHLIAPKKVVGKKIILNGQKTDGAYVTLDDFEDIKIAYSIGIENNIIFDKSLAERGIDVYMYDHTISKIPSNNSKFHWEQIGITGKTKTNDRLKTIEELIEKNGHTLEKNMILKIDCEGCEWDSLNDLPEKILYQFKYIIIELHFESRNVELYYNVLNKLHKSHQVFFLRCNGRDNIVKFGNNRFCKFPEISYVIRENNSFEEDDSIYPIYEYDFQGPNYYHNRLEMNLNILKVFS